MRTNIFEINHLEILKTIEKQKSYYIGGTLCVDLDKHEVLCYNLNEMVSCFVSGDKKLLSIEETKLVFENYKKFRGETPHYQQSVQNSIIKYLI